MTLSEQFQLLGLQQHRRRQNIGKSKTPLMNRSRSVSNIAEPENIHLSSVTPQPNKRKKLSPMNGNTFVLRFLTEKKELPHFNELRFFFDSFRA